jgi:hypothetical protein
MRQQASGSAAPPRTAVKATAAQRGATPRTRFREYVVDEEVEISSHRSLFRAMASFIASMVVHMAAMILLTLWALPGIVDVVQELTAVQERDQEELTELADARITPSTNLVANAAGSVLTQGHASALPTPTQPVFNSDVVEKSDINVRVGDTIAIGSVPAGAMILKVPEGAPGDPQSPVNNIAEAMDRLTREIILMLETGKVQIIWLFDESGSMKEEQKEIRDKIERVYTELGLLGATKGDHLTSAVASYGEKLHIHTQTPTANLETIKAHMGQVPTDETGKEAMCRAISETIGYYRPFAQRGQRQLAMVILTDETGDKTDQEMKLVEPTVRLATESRCRIYVLGREAVFGYPYAYMRWTDAKTSIAYWLQIDRGPETPYVEQLQTEGFWRRWDAHGSGFGPYEQSRLAKETGGIFFILPSPEVNLVARQDFKYEIQRMRPFLPSLESREEYLLERERSKLQLVLWKVISDLNPWDPETGKIINLRDHYSLDNAEFTKQAAVEMGKADKYVRYLHRAQQELDEAVPLREREIYPRWRANFDLVHAQVIAYKVRVYQYGAYLHWFLTHPNERPQLALRPPANNPNLTSFWDIQHTTKTLGTDKYPRDKMDADIKRATEMLQKLMKEYDGTPWAKRAEWELRRSFGVHLKQGWDDRRRGVGVKLPKL